MKAKLLTALFILTSIPLLANFSHITIHMDKLTCPLCVKRLHKQLSKMPAYLDLEPDYENANIYISLDDASPLNWQKFLAYVKKARVKAKSATITASGNVQKTDKNIFFFPSKGFKFYLHPDSQNAFPKPLNRALKNNSLINITASIHNLNSFAPQLAPSKITN